jgi:hypothetical protein
MADEKQNNPPDPEPDKQTAEKIKKTMPLWLIGIILMGVGGIAHSMGVQGAAQLVSLVGLGLIIMHFVRRKKPQQPTPTAKKNDTPPITPPTNDRWSGGGSGDTA